ncbi:MAG TPA: glycosyl hydrolase [Chloroflexia bacterium]|nr:glycosyl hydrolase [Chloroflexia bacterium]
MHRPTRREIGLLVLGLLAMLGGLVLILPPAGPEQRGLPLPLPATATTVPRAPVALPRGYGVAVGYNRGTATDLDLLGPVWYYNYQTRGVTGAHHPYVLLLRPADMPSDSGLSSLITANPGHWWMIGNEPNDPNQDNQSAAAYTRYYVHTAAIIKAADRTAGILPAGIADADPKWAAAFQAEYLRQTGAPLDVDAWNIHCYLLDTDDPYDFFEFKRRVLRFRAWMEAEGQGEKPLVLSEFGVLYGAGCCNRPLDSSGAGLSFMRQALPWLEASGAVTAWAWFTLDSGDQQFHGNLLSPVLPPNLSDFGALYSRRARAFNRP